MSKFIVIKESESLSLYHLYYQEVILRDSAKCGWPLISEYANVRKNIFKNLIRHVQHIL